MKIAIGAVLTIVIGLGGIVGVYQFRESRMTPGDLDEMRNAERRLAEAEEASGELDLTITEDTATETDSVATEETTSETGSTATPEENSPEPIAVAQIEEEEPVAREWKQIDAPGFSPTKPFYIKFACSMGDFVVEFQPEWSPNGVKRIHELMSIKYFDDIRFYRVVEGFMAQFGISGDRALSSKWGNANIQDDPVKQSNTRGAVTFAMGGPNTRSSQLFINFGDNSRLDHYGAGFPPIGRVISGMDAVDKIFSGYGDMPSQGGSGPRPDLIGSGGNKYLNEYFPKLDYIKKARFVEPAEVEAEDEIEAEAA